MSILLKKKTLYIITPENVSKFEIDDKFDSFFYLHVFNSNPIIRFIGKKYPNKKMVSSKWNWEPLYYKNDRCIVLYMQ